MKIFGEVCVTSRHPDPRHVWKGGPEARPMTPDPGNPRDVRDPGENSRPPIPLQTSIEKSTSGPLEGQFSRIFRERGHKGTRDQREPKELLLSNYYYITNNI